MRASVALGVGAALLALVVVLVAVWPAAALTQGTDDVAANEALAGELRELTRSQERTAAALERLEAILVERLDAPPAPGVRSPAASGPPPESFDELIASLDALRATFEVESGRTREMIRSAPAFGGESLPEVKQRSPEPNWVALDELEKSLRTAPRGRCGRQTTSTTPLAS